MILSHSNPNRPQLFFMTILLSLKNAFPGIAATSAAINVLAMTGSFFMLQVYDRVIPAHSLPTLVGLGVIAATLYVFQGILEFIRSQLLMRVGMSVDERFGRVVYQSLFIQSNHMQTPDDGLQSVRDLDTVRGFLSGLGPTALFDIPWMPFYLGLCFLFHVWIGVTALAGAVTLVALTILAEHKSRQPAKEAAEVSTERLALAQSCRRNSEAVLAMGFGHLLGRKWADVNRRYLDNHFSSISATISLATLSRILRMMLQSIMLGVGASLVIRQEATGGTMIASSILMSRALAPVELAIGQWKGFARARESWSRLIRLADVIPPTRKEVVLGRPTEILTVENLHLAAPGARNTIVRGIAFELRSGQALGVIGPSASGKSSLGRGLVGLWQPVAGTVRLDGAAVSQWGPQLLGTYIGYLSQDVALFGGTIADNIARHDPDASSEKVIHAAKAAGVYDMVVQFKDGFNTRIGEQGSVLSAGQRQQIGLARALYGDPFLVVLDEPNSNLDADGDKALSRAIMGIRSRGGIAVVIAHRPSALEAVDKVLVLEDGHARSFGWKDEVLRRTTQS
ncbi:type I secretion system permease/ATPase [Neorhizobium galegae]|uniref:type I secretion system permease/ATPase n=1 Tax=Neorhizobium galegae TaxID=399 RepID=UPI001F2F424A|nr:type I secretion system permease/ATPase [Neorhizobium galegae]UIK09009.1 type I secretion system permease/ATPase [Neorhizobium galegae]